MMKSKCIALIVLGAWILAGCQMAPRDIPPVGSETPPGLKQITELQKQALQKLFVALIDHRPESCEAIGLRQAEQDARSSAELTECVSPDSDREEVFDKVVWYKKQRQIQVYLSGKYYVHGTYDLEIELPEVFQDAVYQPGSSVSRLDGERYSGRVDLFDISQYHVRVIFYSKYVGKDGLSPQLERVKILR